MIEEVVTREEIARLLEAETQRVDDAASGAERLAARLRELGVEPD